MPGATVLSRVPELQEETDPEGVDYGWVMQTTFVLTIVVGAPTVVALSLFYTLPSWASRVSFAVRVGAVVWLLTALATYWYARRNADE
nr:DUF5822 domain-containing protein [Halobacterium noricense]